MNDRETRRYDMFGSVHTFGKDSTSNFANAHHDVQYGDNALIKARFDYRWEDQFKGAEVYAKV